MRYSLLPTKNILLSQSIIVIAGVILDIIKNNTCDVDSAFAIYNNEYVQNSKVKCKIEFNQFILALCMLYSIKRVNITKTGGIYYENY